MLVVRALLYFGIWIVVDQSAEPAHLLVGALASAAEAWASVKLLPAAVLALLVGGVALMGVLPSDAYLAKKLLLASLALALSLAAMIGSLSAELISNPLSPSELGNTLAVLAGGTLLALGLARRPLLGATGAAESGPRGAALALGGAFEAGDRAIRRWPAMSLALLFVAACFGALLARA